MDGGAVEVDRLIAVEHKEANDDAAEGGLGGRGGDGGDGLEVIPAGLREEAGAAGIGFEGLLVLVEEVEADLDLAGEGLGGAEVEPGEVGAVLLDGEELVELAALDIGDLIGAGLGGFGPEIFGREELVMPDAGIFDMVEGIIEEDLGDRLVGKDLAGSLVGICGPLVEEIGGALSEGLIGRRLLGDAGEERSDGPADIIVFGDPREAAGLVEARAVLGDAIAGMEEVCAEAEGFGGLIEGGVERWGIVGEQAGVDRFLEGEDGGLETVQGGGEVEEGGCFPDALAKAIGWKGTGVGAGVGYGSSGECLFEIGP